MKREITVADLTVAAAVNDRAILANCLQRSPDIAAGTLPLRIYEGYPSASEAYNRAIEDAGPDRILILAHQDVYLPAGYAALLVDRLNTLARLDPEWAVAGLIGMDRASAVVGNVWSTGLDSHLNSLSPLPAAVETLDELLLIIRTAQGLRFDPRLPGFHLYATDIIQTAKAQGRASYAIDAPAIHHDKPIIALDASYKRAYRYMQRKWRARLPIPTLIVPLTRSWFAIHRKDLRVRWWRRKLKSRVIPTSDPRGIARAIGLEPPV
jgi:hypothetical protein